MKQIHNTQTQLLF